MKLIKSFDFAFSGLVQALKEQTNLRIHFTVAIVVVITGFYFQITLIEWVLLLITIMVVISLELINTAIEYLTNLVTKERNPLAGKVKDVAAAAVLFASLMAVIIGFLIFFKYLFPTSNS